MPERSSTTTTGNRRETTTKTAIADRGHADGDDRLAEGREVVPARRDRLSIASSRRDGTREVRVDAVEAPAATASSAAPKAGPGSPAPLGERNMIAGARKSASSTRNRNVEKFAPRKRELPVQRDVADAEGRRRRGGAPRSPSTSSAKSLWSSSPFQASFGAGSRARPPPRSPSTGTRRGTAAAGARVCQSGWTFGPGDEHQAAEGALVHGREQDSRAR